MGQPCLLCLSDRVQGEEGRELRGQRVRSIAACWLAGRGEKGRMGLAETESETDRERAIQRKVGWCELACAISFSCDFDEGEIATRVAWERGP